MYIPAAQLYKGSTLWVSQQPHCTRAVSYGYPSSPTVQRQYPIGTHAALIYKDTTLWLSKQPYCTRAVPYGYHSSPTVQRQYPMSIQAAHGQCPLGTPAALLYKDGTLCISQQPYCTRAMSYEYSSSLTVQGQYHMDISAAILYKDSTQWLSQQHYCSDSNLAALLHKGSTLWVS